MCAFLVAGRGLVQARCERRGGGRRASAACGGGYGPRSGDPAVSASTAARGAYRYSGVAVARLGRAAAPCGAAQRDEMAVIVNSRNACCAAVSLALAGALLRLGPEGASEALFCTRGVLQRQRGGYKRPMAKQRGLGRGPLWGNSTAAAARLLGALSIPRAPTPPPPEVSTAAAKANNTGFTRAQKLPIAASYRPLRRAGVVLSVATNPEDGQLEKQTKIRRSRGCRVDKPFRATKNATRPRGDDT